jgi:hypothetical protein
MKVELNRKLRQIFVGLLIFSVAIQCMGQMLPERSTTILESGNCEIDEANLDTVRQAALRGVGDGEVLIVVARLEHGATRANLNRQRLDAVKESLSKHGFPEEKIILAEGERVDGRGRVEFYISGKLSHVILTNRNKGICSECCNPAPEDFTHVRKRRRKS